MTYAAMDAHCLLGIFKIFQAKVAEEGFYWKFHTSISGQTLNVSLSCTYFFPFNIWNFDWSIFVSSSLKKLRVGVSLTAMSAFYLSKWIDKFDWSLNIQHKPLGRNRPIWHWEKMINSNLLRCRKDTRLSFITGT